MAVVVRDALQLLLLAVDDPFARRWLRRPRFETSPQSERARASGMAWVTLQFSEFTFE